jgi:hypothetical protein
VGCEHEFCPKHRHELNGVVERAIQTVGVSFRAMMIHGGAPDSDIPNALIHANVIRNNTPTSANKGWTPKEKDCGRRLGPNRRLLKAPLFCLCYAAIYKADRGTHDPHGIPCVYLGYDDRNSQYKVKEWASGRIYYTADCVFHQTIFPYRANAQYAEKWINEMDAVTPRIPVSADDPAPHSMLTGPRRSMRMHQFLHSGGRRIADIPDVDVGPGGEAAINYIRALYIHTFGPDPENWAEALASEHANEWIRACLEELNSFRQHNVYSLVPRATAKGKKIYKPRPVFKIKVNPPEPGSSNATLDKFKFRQTIAAFTKTMTPGIDYAEKRASTVRWESSLVLFATAVQHDLDITLVDIKTFFLYGELTDTVFMEQPPEWVSDEKPAEEWICKLNRSMYGLPQAPHCAQRKLDGVILANDTFRKSIADDCVYVRGTPTDPTFVAMGTHVDDALSVGTTAGVDALIATMGKEFELSVTRNPAQYTGVQIIRDRERGWLKLHQGAYIENMLEVFGMESSSPADTPMDPGTAKTLQGLELATDDSRDLKVERQYRSLVGMLIWLYKTRPDMLFTINLLARFLRAPTQRHLDLARGRPLRYLRGTTTAGVCFLRTTGTWVLSGQSDAGFADDLATSRSTRGHFFRFGDFGAVSFNCTLERKLCTSTQQAETYALASACRDAEFLRLLSWDLGFEQSEASQVDVDNEGAYQQSTKQINHATAKHFRVAQHFIRWMSNRCQVKVVKVHTSVNGADMFTKALPADSFRRHRSLVMGPQSAPDSVQCNPVRG